VSTAANEEALWEAAIADVKAFVGHMLAAHGHADQVKDLSDVDEVAKTTRRTWDTIFPTTLRHAPKCRRGACACRCRAWSLITAGILSSIAEMPLLTLAETLVLVEAQAPVAICAFDRWYDSRKEHAHAVS
jgi:hypothetical protein